MASLSLKDFYQDNGVRKLPESSAQGWHGGLGPSWGHALCVKNKEAARAGGTRSLPSIPNALSSPFAHASYPYS